MPDAEKDASVEAGNAILVTGATSGIGLATARLFARRGWLVGALDVNGAALEKLRDELGHERIFTNAIDVTDRAAVLAAVESFAARTGGRLDILLANAGIDAKGRFEAMPWERVVGVVGVNLLGALPKTGMLRVLSAEAVAEAVLAAYHGDKLHWYVPEELAAYDVEVTTRPEAARDRRIAGGI